jgi:hypothetical protein
MSLIGPPPEPDFGLEYLPSVTTYNPSWASDRSTSNSAMGHKHSKARPPQPPQPPQAPKQACPSTGGCQSASTSTEPANSANFASVSPTNLMSSQLFKDELKLQQSRLSPNPDSGQLSIDERIRLRRETDGRSLPARSHANDTNHVPSSSQPNRQAPGRLPDKLLTTSSAQQRDKQPFAYSPDVSDPNNRGKLDLSQIKSPTMRRRLLANMESSSSGDDEFIAQTAGSSDGQGNSTSPVRSSDRSDSKLNAVARPNEQLDLGGADMSNDYLKRQQQPQQQQQQQAASVHYSAEPPRFYELDQTDRDYRHSAEAKSKPQTGQGLNQQALYEDYLTTLNAEIAESLESLSMLANRWDPAGAKSAIGHENQSDAGSRAYETPAREQLSRVSTFVPPLGSFNEQHHGRPSFYSVLPSGRPAPDYPAWHDMNYFSPSTISEPYPMAPYYGAPLDVNEAYDIVRESSRHWERPTSQRTFAVVSPPQLHGHDHHHEHEHDDHHHHLQQQQQLLLLRQQHHQIRQQQMDSRACCDPRVQCAHVASSSQSISSPSISSTTSSRIYGEPASSVNEARTSRASPYQYSPDWALSHDNLRYCNGDSHSIGQVRDLQNMTAQLEKEVNRLYTMNLSRGTGK